MARTRWIVASFLASFALASGGCKKDEKGGDKPADKPADKAADPAVKPAEPPKPVEDKDGPPAKAPNDGPHAADLALIPIDSELVMGVNIAQLAQSALWKDYLAERVLSDSIKAVLDELKSKCQLDAFAVVKTATIGAKGLQAANKDGVIVAHGLDKTKTLACADKIKAEKDAKVEIAQEGDVTIIKPKAGGDKGLAITFVNDNTALAVFGAKANATDIKAIAASTTGVKQSGRFVDMYNKLETTKAGWMMFKKAPKSFDALAQMGLKPRSVSGALDLASGLVLSMRMRLESKDQAAMGEGLMKQQMGALASLIKFDKVDVTSDNEDLNIIITVLPANLGPVLAQIQKVAKLMGGGGGGGAGSGMQQP